MKKFMHDTLTNTQDVKAESVVHRLVDKLIWHAVKADMACQRDSTSTFTLNTNEISKKHQVHTYQSINH